MCRRPNWPRYSGQWAWLQLHEPYEKSREHHSDLLCINCQAELAHFGSDEPPMFWRALLVPDNDAGRHSKHWKQHTNRCVLLNSSPAPSASQFKASTEFAKPAMTEDATEGSSSFLSLSSSLFSFFLLLLPLHPSPNTVLPETHCRQNFGAQFAVQICIPFDRVQCHPLYKNSSSHRPSALIP